MFALFFTLDSEFTVQKTLYSVYFTGLSLINPGYVSSFPCRLLNLLELIYRKKGFNNIISRALEAIGSRFSFQELPLAFRFLLHLQNQEGCMLPPPQEAMSLADKGTSRHLAGKMRQPPPAPESSAHPTPLPNQLRAAAFEV